MPGNRSGSTARGRRSARCALVWSTCSIVSPRATIEDVGRPRRGQRARAHGNASGVRRDRWCTAPTLRRTSDNAALGGVPRAGVAVPSADPTVRVDVRR